MSPSIFFNDKKYISAKEASTQTGYSQDYIGQLSRAGKIDSRRIGRTWYVSEESLSNYKNFLNKEGLPEFSLLASKPAPNTPTVDEVRQKIEKAKGTVTHKNLYIPDFGKHTPLKVLSPIRKFIIITSTFLSVAGLLYFINSVTLPPQNTSSLSANSLSATELEPASATPTSESLAQAFKDFVTPSSQINSSVLADAYKNYLSGNSVQTASNQENIRPSATPKISSMPSISELTAAVEKIISLPSIQAELRGPQGPAGPQGTSGIATSIGVATSLPPIYIPSGASQPNPISNYNGGSIFNATNLSSGNFTTDTASTTSDLTVGGNATVANNLTVNGGLTAIGTINPSLTQGSIYFQGASGMAEDNANLFYDAADHRLGVGTNSPQTTLQIVGTDALVIPVGTTTQRPADIQGAIRYNTTTHSFEGYSGTNWAGLGGVMDVDQDTYILPELSPGSDENTLYFYTNNAEQMRIMPNGGINLDAVNPVLDTTDSGSTLSINTTTNRPVTFGTGIVTIPNLAVTNSQGNNGTMSIDSSATTQTIFTVTGNDLTSGTGIADNITANAGNGQMTNGHVINLNDATTAGGGFTALAIGVTGIGTGSGNKYLLDLNPNEANNDVVFDNNGAFRPTTSVASNTDTIGSPSFYFKNGYFDQITANSIAGTVVSGATSSDTWTVGSSEVGDVNEALIFQRNSGSGNALLQWHAGAGDQRYLSANYPFNATYTVTDASIGQSINLLSADLTNNTTGGTQNLLSLTNTGTGTTANGIYLNNTGTGTTAISINGTWTNGIVTNNNSINAGTGTVTAATFSGALTGNVTGNVSGNAGTVTTDANLSGAVTSVGNTTSLGSFTSANLAGALTDETGSGAVVFANTPTFVSPILGAATATTINGNTFTTGTGTLTLGAGTTFTNSDNTTLATNAITLGGGEVVTFSPTNALTLSTTGATSVTLPTSGTLVSSVTTGNGVSAVNTAGALAFTLGAITPSTINGNTFTTGTGTITITGTKTLTVADTASISGTNTGDNAANSSTMFIGTTSQALNRASASEALTGITSIDGSAATLTTSHNLWGQSFNGSADVSGSLTAVGNITGGASSMTILAGTGASRTLTLQTTTSGSAAQTNLTLNADQSSTFSGAVALGANNLTMTGSLAATGARVTKGWFTDIESTNIPTVNGASINTAGTLNNVAYLNAANLFTNNQTITKTTEQLRLAYDGSDYNAFTVGSTGSLTIAATGTNPNITLTPGGTGTTNLNGHIVLEGVTSTGATGSGKFVFDTSPILVTPALGTPSSGVGTNITGITAAHVVAGTFGTGTYTMDTSLVVPEVDGSTAANGVLTLQGTTNATRTTSYINLQPNGGNVGIGTTNPSYALDLSSATSVTDSSGLNIVGRFLQSNSPGAGAAINVMRGTSGTWLGFDNSVNSVLASTNSLRFLMGSSPTERMRLSAAGGLSLGSTYASTDPGAGSMIVSGNVGIGVTNPAATLAVKGASTTTTQTLTFSTSGVNTFQVPADVTSIQVKAWGAGGGGGAGDGTGGHKAGGNGGGGGFAAATITVTQGESLTVSVGAGGQVQNHATYGGMGGGYSALQRGSTYLIQAGGGGGGGGTASTTNLGGNGGAGGGSSGVAGSTVQGNGGGAGTNAAGGAGGSGNSGSSTDGSAGVANAGGNAGTTTGSGGANRTGGGGLGGADATGGGGGGGGGRFGGGGGEAGSNTTTSAGGGGGGGGSDLVTGSSTTETAGSGTAAGNNGDSSYTGSAGQGGSGNVAFGSATAGNDGLVVITYQTAVPVLSLLSSTSANLVTVLNSGNFGIGTSTPKSLLEVAVPTPQKQIFILTPGLQAYTVPSDWNNSKNKIEVIGGGASATFWAAGGGGAYSASTNVTLIPGASVEVKVGVGGSAGNPGDDTFICNTNVSCTTIGAGGVQVGAKGGGATTDGADITGGTGGAAGSGVGTTKNSGGNGGNGFDNGGFNSGGGGGGAAGPNGNGSAGGNASSTVGGNGGSGDAGSGGAGGTGGNQADGTNGSGGTEFDLSHGSGGGAGGGGTNAVNSNHAPGTSGSYGAGGAGGGGDGTGGSGAGTNGIIVLTYTPSAGSSTALSVSSTSGYVGVGNSAPAVPLDVQGSNTGGAIARFIDKNSTGCTISTGGIIACSSDVNLKKNIQDLNYDLDTLMALRPVDFNWNSQDDSAPKSLGFIAQEVQKVMPELVTTDPNTGYEELNTIGMIPVITKSVQELNLNLDAIAGTVTPLTGSASESFMTAFFANIEKVIGGWLADASNGISNIFAGSITVQNEICINQTCVNEAQLKEMLANVGSAPSPSQGEGGGEVAGGGGNSTPNPNAPVITLTGTTPMNINVGDTYTDQGATATDSNGDSISVITTGSVDTTTAGTYTINYNATDSAGNQATQVTRTVIVNGSTPPPADTTPPVITLNGDSTINLNVGDTYTEQGATATDNVDTNVAVIISGSVDTSTAGTYTVDYDATDAAGNHAIEVVRTVIVSAVGGGN